MDRRRWLAWLLFVPAAIGLAGCGDALTVHRVAGALDAAPDVPSISGHWIIRSDDGEPSVLQVDGNDAAGARCRSVKVTYVEGSDRVELGDEVCFVEFAGHLVAELQAVSEPQFYRQYLVRIDDEKIEVCGAHPIWLMLKWLKEDRPTGYSLDSLAYTSRDEGDTELLVLIAEAKEMRSFLEIALPELSAACDSGGEDLFQWYPFEKMSPQEQEAEAAPGE